MEVPPLTITESTRHGVPCWYVTTWIPYDNGRRLQVRRDLYYMPDTVLSTMYAHDGPVRLRIRKQVQRA